jgi:diguanylate cyclase (GGDEF)-like protein
MWKLREPIAALLVGLLAVAGIAQLRHHSEDRKNAQLLLAQIEAATERQSGIQLRLLAIGVLDESGTSFGFAAKELKAQLIDLRARGGTALSDLIELEGSASVEDVNTAFVGVSEHLRVVQDLIDDDRIDEGYIYTRQRLDPLLEDLRVVIDAASLSYGERSDKASALADIGAAMLVVLGLVALFALRRAVERERLIFQQRLQHEALHDPLTNLANRRLLRERIEQAVGLVQRRREPIGVLVLDIDCFKQVNDGMGHDSGDQLLIQVAERLSSCTRTSDTVARLGGDEFAILLNDLRDAQNVQVIGDRLMDSFDEPFLVKGQKVSVLASMGITLASRGDEEVDQLIDEADQAMYQAKRNGRAHYRLFAPPLSHFDSPDVALAR